MEKDYDYAMTDSVKIAIVGSGPSGLSAASHAA
jgi:flavin-dependent dehydrogenase